MNGDRVPLVAAQRAAVDALKRELFGDDPISRSRYVRAFHEEFRDYTRVASYDDLVVGCYRADLVLIGDYHALAESQRFAARLLEDVARRSRRVVLAVEMVYARQQAPLDAWMAGRISDEEFRARIRYDLDWGYDWEGPRHLLATARRLGVRTFGIDGPRRGGVRTLRRRDTLAAARLAALAEACPDAKILVLFGESHLAAGHLPGRLAPALLRRGLERRVLRVAQNVDEIYWKLLERGLEHREVVEVGERCFVVLTGSPLRKYEAYRRTLVRWNADREDDDEPDLAPTVHAMIDMILRYLGVDPGRRRLRGRGPLLVDLYPDVYGRDELAMVSRILEEAGLVRADRAGVLQRVRRSGSCFVPSANMILLGAHRLTHAGEEAAHFVHQALSGALGRRRPPGRRHDIFYREVMEEALGFFGSKIVDPSRNLFVDSPLFRKGGERDTDRGSLDRVLEFVLAHRALERDHRDMDTVPKVVLRAIHGNDPLFSSYAHHLGYFLGQRLYDAHRAGKVDRAAVRGLFRSRFDRAGEPLRRYLDLVGRLGESATD